jgi:hypothetical protein
VCALVGAGGEGGWVEFVFLVLRFQQEPFGEGMGSDKRCLQISECWQPAGARQVAETETLLDAV